MTAEITTPDSIIAAINNLVAPKLNSKAIALGSVTAVVGIAIFTASRIMSVDYPIIYMLLATVGILAIIAGLIRIFAAKRQYKIISNGQPIELVSYYYDAGEFNKVKSHFDKSDFKGLAAIRHGDNGGVRLDCCTSRDNSFVAMQIYRYVPYAFEPASEVNILEGTEAQDICQLLKK